MQGSAKAVKALFNTILTGFRLMKKYLSLRRII